MRVFYPVEYDSEYAQELVFFSSQISLSALGEFSDATMDTGQSMPFAAFANLQHPVSVFILFLLLFSTSA